MCRQEKILPAGAGRRGRKKIEKAVVRLLKGKDDRPLVRSRYTKQRLFPLQHFCTSGNGGKISGIRAVGLRVKQPPEGKDEIVCLQVFSVRPLFSFPQGKGVPQSVG